MARKKKYTNMQILFVILFLIIVITGFFLYNNFFIVGVQKKMIQFEIGDKIAFNVDTDAIYLGRTYPGGGARRNVFIINSYDFPLIVSVKIKGNISTMMTISENDFIVKPGENKTLTYYAQTKDGMPLGIYKGETIIIFRRVLFS